MTASSMGLLKLTEPWFDKSEQSAVADVLTSGHLVQAGRVAEFERLFAVEVGVEHAVMVSSGTAALHLTMLACNIGPGDAVAIPDFTFVATANAVALTGAVPLFVEVDPDTYNMDVSALRQTVERAVRRARDGSLTLRMILPVHQFGVPAEMDPIAEVAKEHGLYLVEDAACALGSRYRDRGIGAWGIASCFSFHPRKVITTGEGGAVVTNDGKLAGRLRALRAHGFAVQPGPPDLIAKGLNYRMTEIQAALGISQMGKLSAILRQRQVLAKLMHNHLEEIPWFKRPMIPAHLTANWQSYVGVLASGVNRAKIVSGLADQGIEARPGATAIHLLKPYRSLTAPGDDSCPVSRMLDAKTLALPLHPRMNETDIKRIAMALSSIEVGNRS